MLVSLKNKYVGIGKMILECEYVFLISIIQIVSHFGLKESSKQSNCETRIQNGGYFAILDFVSPPVDIVFTESQISYTNLFVCPSCQHAQQKNSKHWPS